MQPFHDQPSRHRPRRSSLIDCSRWLFKLPLRQMPYAVQRRPLQLFLNQVFQVSIKAGDLEFLRDRCVAVEITDLSWRWPITLGKNGLELLPREHPSETLIRGEVPEFLAMAGRFTDPDTLFFQRRIVIEGNTELGLFVKNFLDGMDPENLPKPLQLVLSCTEHLRTYWQPGARHNLHSGSPTNSKKTSPTENKSNDSGSTRTDTERTAPPLKVIQSTANAKSPPGIEPT